ncbi:MAG TPA: hypothetical protein QGF05_15125 [Dehalococcoidia bacterium]|nr:hypothetical protein [Dehalococcoidia bacterium]
MLEFTELLTVAPSNVLAEDIQTLRDAGWSDEDIIDIVHMTALINYFNRIGDALGVDLDDMLQVAEDRDREFVDPAAWAQEQPAPAGD